VFEELGSVGVWQGRNVLTPELAATIESLGFGAIWIGGSPPADLQIVEDLLAATETITVATGIVNTWKDEAAPVADSYHRIEARFPGRFLLGIGVGHPEAVSQYTKPFENLVNYLDVLDQHEVPVSRRVLAALGPKALRLSAERTAGAHPYLTTPEHTRRAREILGPDILLAPEQKVVVDTDVDRARALGRTAVKPYLGLRNYVNNLLWTGFSEDDVAGEGSDELIDALALQGDADSIALRARGHLDAGANHVCVQLVTEPGADLVPGLTALAAAFFG
jgi:probable F420-dependent oxidoreductase